MAAPSSERNLWYRARRKLEELKLAREQREVVPYDEALGSFSRSVHGVKGRVFGTASKVAPLLVGETDPKKIAKVIRDELYDCFLALADGEINKIVEGACATGDKK